MLHFEIRKGNISLIGFERGGGDTQAQNVFRNQLHSVRANAANYISSLGTRIINHIRVSLVSI